MTNETLKYALDLRAKIDGISMTLERLNTIEEDSDVHKLNNVIGMTGITEFPSLRALTYEYAVKCRKLLKLDLAEAERTLKEL